MTTRHFGALRRAIDSLRSYYEADLPAMIAKPLSLPDPTFPHQNQYTSLIDNKGHDIVYVGNVKNLVFLGKTDKNKDICIKFVRSYSKDVHIYCASIGSAPALHGFESLPGGWFMVVMDMLDAPYQSLDDSALIANEDLPELPLMETVTSLHQAGFVHGDLRDSNIWVNTESLSKFMLTDFDWSGVIGTVRYPMNVYAGYDLWRPKGASDGQLIEVGHDVDMVKHIFR